MSIHWSNNSAKFHPVRFETAEPWALILEEVTSTRRRRRTRCVTIRRSVLALKNRCYSFLADVITQWLCSGSRICDVRWWCKTGSRKKSASNSLPSVASQRCQHNSVLKLKHLNDKYKHELVNAAHAPGRCCTNPHQVATLFCVKWRFETIEPWVFWRSDLGSTAPTRITWRVATWDQFLVQKS